MNESAAVASFSSRQRSCAPRLVFDDGSRSIKITENGVVRLSDLKESSSGSNKRGRRATAMLLRDYYEIDRLVHEIRALIAEEDASGNETLRRQQQRDGWKLRVALQFPDELLHDAPCVCWELERALAAVVSSSDDVLVFCLGDTTYAPCCPDQVAAAHLQADCLVHFGHACLSSCRDVAVLYSFGQEELVYLDECVSAVSKQVVVAEQEHQKVDRILLLYEVQYAHAMSDLRGLLLKQHDDESLQIIMGQIPLPVKRRIPRPSGCNTDCSCHTGDGDAIEQDDNKKQERRKELDNDESPLGTFVVGGLELPKDVDFSSGNTALLFIGSDTSRQYLNIMLRFLSESGIRHYWTWNPPDATLSTEPSPSFQRNLNRRFYLVQKAKNCTVFGILVANLSDSHMRTVVQALRGLLDEHGRVSYVLVVGKINPAKLANFAEIECFVLVACPEHSLLEDDREFATPILTPLELSMALGVTEWGSVPYSLDRVDFLEHASMMSSVVARPLKHQDEPPDDDDSDAPYFSLVTGRYESAPSRDKLHEETDLASLPGKGQLSAYHSAAADFLKQREYKGLEVHAGLTKVQAAVKGHEGIASNYGDR